MSVSSLGNLLACFVSPKVHFSNFQIFQLNIINGKFYLEGKFGLPDGVHEWQALPPLLLDPVDKVAHEVDGDGPLDLGVAVVPWLPGPGLLGHPRDAVVVEVPKV